jgi:hypothetical protein
VKYVWVVLGVLYALMSIYVGYLFVISAMEQKLGQKGFTLQAPPFLGGIALILFSLPLLWNAARLAISKAPSY